MATEFIALPALCIGAYVFVLFMVSIMVRRNDIADVAWGVGIFLVALMSYLTGPQTVPLLILTILAGLWGFRLTIRIFLRNRRKTEDYRYKIWRDTWGVWFYPRSFLQIYLLQGFLMLVIGYPFIHASAHGALLTMSPLYIIGLCVWCVGYAFEVIGDWQLDRFTARIPKQGTILTSGLWRYSRHPNYFGEITMWWGIWLMVSPLPMSLVALMSPIVITFLIVKVSGIPLLEKKLAANPDFGAYAARTSMLIPLPPKSSK